MPRCCPWPLVLAVLLVLAGCAGQDRPDADLGETAERGRELVASQGCISCHSEDGSDRAGPTFLGAWGSERPLADGRVVVFDEEHVAIMLADPGSRMSGERSARMPAYTGLSDEQVDAITAYLEALGG